MKEKIINLIQTLKKKKKKIPQLKPKQKATSKEFLF